MHTPLLLIRNTGETITHQSFSLKFVTQYQSLAFLLHFPKDYRFAFQEPLREKDWHGHKSLATAALELPGVPAYRSITRAECSLWCQQMSQKSRKRLSKRVMESREFFVLRHPFSASPGHQRVPKHPNTNQKAPVPWFMSAFTLTLPSCSICERALFSAAVVFFGRL